METIDFSWVHNELVTIMLRLIFAGVLSGIIGLEREVKNHPAGFRTHLLVGVGSCLMMILSIFGFENMIDENNIRFDPSRLPSYVVSGIGFLGAGTILVHGMTVRGLTTAASIWVVSGIGLVVGVGMYYVAIFTTIIVILSLIFLNKWEQLFIKKTSSNNSLYLLVINNELSLSKILEMMERHRIIVTKIDIENVLIKDMEYLKYHFQLRAINNQVLPILYDELSRLDAVHKVYTKE